MLQWDEDFAPHIPIDATELVEVIDERVRVSVRFQAGPVRTYDIVILALGFSEEVLVSQVGCPSYWEPYRPRNEPVVVSGTGDGGLIDAAYQIFDNQVIRAARTLAHAVGGKPLAKDVLKIEDEALAQATAGHLRLAQEILNEFYSKVRLEPEDWDLLRPLASRSVGCVTLIHQDPYPFGPFSSPANKLLVAATVACLPARLDFRCAEVKIDNRGNPVEQGATTTTPLDRNRLIVRHGSPSVVNGILNPSQQAALDGKSSATLAAPIEDAYNEKLFLDCPERPIAPSRTHRQGDFYERLRVRVGSLTRHIARGRGNMRLRRSIESEPWIVGWQGRPIPRDLVAVFPLDINRISILFDNSAFVGDAV